MSNFIRQVLEILDEIVANPYGTDGLLVLEEMVQPLNLAWTEFREDFDLERADKLISLVTDEAIQNHGLYGAQSHAKMRVVELRLGIFNGNRTKRTLLWLLDAIDTYLDTVIDATGLGTALKEAKDTLRSSIDD